MPLFTVVRCLWMLLHGSCAGFFVLRMGRKDLAEHSRRSDDGERELSARDDDAFKWK
jgi:hypothetical protein